MAAAVTLLMVVVAVHIGVIAELVAQKGRYRLIGIAADAAVESDPRLAKGVLGSGADSSAQKHIYLQLREQACQSSVAAAPSFLDCGTGNRPVFHLIELKLSAVSKVLEHLSIFIGNCDLHSESRLHR